MELKGIIFDMDGTLLDSMIVWENSAKLYLEKKDIEAPKDIRKDFQDMSLKEAAELFKQKYVQEETIENIIRDINKTVEDFYFTKVKLKDGVLDFLEEFKVRGIKMVIATATDRYLTEAALKRTKIDHYFERIFTCSEVGFGKGQPDIFLEGLKALNLKKEEVIVFEDAFYAVNTAKEAGFKVLAVYDEFETLTEEVAKVCDIYFKNYPSPKELLLEIETLR